MYYFTQCLRWGIQEQLSWLGVSHAVIGKLPAKVPVTWKLDWAGRTHFWGGPLTQLTSQCLLLAGGLSSSSHGPPCRALWVSPQYGDLLSQMFITGHEYTCLHKVGSGRGRWWGLCSTELFRNQTNKSAEIFKMSFKVTLTISIQIAMREREKEMDHERGFFGPGMEVTHFTSTHFTLVRT